MLYEGLFETRNFYLLNRTSLFDRPWLYLQSKFTSRSSSKRAAVGVHQHRINGNCPNNNQSLASHLMKHLDVQFYRTEIGICNLDNKSINDFDF